MSYRLSPAADPAVGFTVNILRAWTRGEGEMQELVMSASSGPKDYTRNHIFAIFDKFPDIARILMVRGEYSEIGKDRHMSPAFLLCVNAAGEVFDMAGELVHLDPLRGA